MPSCDSSPLKSRVDESTRHDARRLPGPSVTAPLVRANRSKVPATRPIVPCEASSGLATMTCQYADAAEVRGVAP
jgi:hypothetical protein